jgi:hypothetical protein
MTRKVELVQEIARLIDAGPFHMSTGSTEPRALFDAVNTELGLGIPPEGTKPEMARGIVEAAGARWLPQYESTGGTVTFDGLRAVLDAVRFFTGDDA